MPLRRIARTVALRHGFAERFFQLDALAHVSRRRVFNGGGLGVSEATAHIRKRSVPFDS